MRNKFTGITKPKVQNSSWKKREVEMRFHCSIVHILHENAEWMKRHEMRKDRDVAYKVSCCRRNRRNHNFNGKYQQEKASRKWDDSRLEICSFECSFRWWNIQAKCCRLLEADSKFMREKKAWNKIYLLIIQLEREENCRSPIVNQLINFFRLYDFKIARINRAGKLKCESFINFMKMRKLLWEENSR